MRLLLTLPLRRRIRTSASTSAKATLRCGGIKELGIKYPVAKDTSASKNYKVVGTPTVLLVDSKGVVRYNGNELPKDHADKLNPILGG